MRIEVDVAKSIKSNRLRAKRTTIEQKINAGFYILLASVFIGVIAVFPTLVILTSTKTETTHSISIYLLFGLFYLIAFLIIYSIAVENRFVRIKGKNHQINKDAIASVLKEVYKTNAVAEGQTVISYYKRATFFKFATRVIILLDDDDILINISRFNQLGIKSFFHPLFSKQIIRSIARNFENKLNS